MKHTTPWTRTDRSVSGSVGVPTSSSAGVGAVREDLADLAGDVPVVDERVVCAGLGDRFGLAWAASGGQDGHPALPGQGRRGQPDRGGATADQDGLPRTGVQACGVIVLKGAFFRNPSW